MPCTPALFLNVDILSVHFNLNWPCGTKANDGQLTEATHFNIVLIKKRQLLFIYIKELMMGQCIQKVLFVLYCKIKDKEDQTQQKLKCGV